MKEKSVKKNYLYNLIYQVLTLILPLITTPYISRVLGPHQIGIYSYTNSVVTYFILFGSLGVSLYGQREIAYIGDDVSKRKKTFWEIIFLRFIAIAISMAIYYFAIVRNSEYALYYKILGIYLIASALDISWLFQGLEDFKKTVGRNLIVRTTSVILIFMFVKQPEDLTKFLIIYSFADLLGNISLWFYLPKLLRGEKLGKINILRHFIPIIILFIPQIAVRIYNIMDKTMLGKMIVDKAELGNYEESYKIINVLFTIISSLGLVMLPKIASLYNRGEEERLRIYLKKSFNFVFFLTFPMTFGIMAVAKEFIPFFLGAGYDRAVGITQVLAPLLILSGITNVIGTQYMLSVKKHKEYTISILAGLIVNVILNVILIKTHKAVGAAFATIVAQAVVVIVQSLYVRYEMDMKNILKMTYKYFFASIIMFAVCYLIGKIMSVNGIITMCLKTAIGVITYLLVLILLQDSYLKNLKGDIKNIIFRKQ